jgi:hypothetical protein
LDDLKTLIEELEKEKADLLRLIDEAVKDQEFLSAHFHSEALGQVNRQIQTLKNLDDESYDKKYFLEKVIENYKKLLKEETSDNSKSMINRFIDEKEKELSDLNQIKKQKEGNGNHLKDNLDQFFKGKITGIRVIISNPDNLSIEIRRAKAGIKLTMPNIKKLQTKHVLSENRLFKLRGLGFLLNERGDEATTTLKKSKNSEELTDKIMKLISIIVFEVFYFKELGKDAAIEIFNKKIPPGDKQ